MKLPVNFRHLVPLFATILLVGCDPFRDDLIRPENEFLINSEATQYYILSGSPAIIDLKSMVSAQSGDVTMTVVAEPVRGALTRIGPSLARYIPAFDFIDGVDEFELLFESRSKSLTQVVTIHAGQNVENFPCALYAAEDYSYTTPGQSVLIPFLNNDHICGISMKDVEVEIFVAPVHGEAHLMGDTIVYSPAKSFLGTDEIIYRIGTYPLDGAESNSSTSSYGIIKVNVSDESCPFFILQEFTLDLTDGIDDPISNGECAGGYAITLWGVETPPCQNYGYYVRQLRQTANSGIVCFGRAGDFAYVPDPLKSEMNDAAEFEVCVNAQCRKVTINIIREKSN